MVSGHPCQSQTFNLRPIGIAHIFFFWWGELLIDQIKDAMHLRVSPSLWLSSSQGHTNISIFSIFSIGSGHNSAVSDICYRLEYFNDREGGRNKMKNYINVLNGMFNLYYKFITLSNLYPSSVKCKVTSITIIESKKFSSTF